jgi:hypothetical protein
MDPAIQNGLRKDTRTKKGDEKMQQIVAVIGQRYVCQAEPPLILDDYSTCKHEQVKEGPVTGQPWEKIVPPGYGRPALRM